MNKHNIPSVLHFVGPHSICDNWNELGEVTNDGGVYLWCIENSGGTFLVHYIGEAQNIRQRTVTHYKQQMKGKNHAWCPKHLRKNIRVLMHRAGFGLVDTFSRLELDCEDANKNYLSSLSLFYAKLPSEYSRSDRCQFETALAYAVEDSGQNVLSVSHLHKLRHRQWPVNIDTSPHSIAGLSNHTLHV